MQSKSTPPHDKFASTDAENINQRVRNGRAVAYRGRPTKRSGGRPSPTATACPAACK